MDFTIRPYDPATDHDAVGRFLIEAYEDSDRLLNWMQPRWEYMHAHPAIAETPVHLIAVFEHQRAIVGVVHPEHAPDAVYLQRRRGYDSLLPAMLDYVEPGLGVEAAARGETGIGVFIGDFDSSLQRVAAERGYAPIKGSHEGYSSRRLDDPLPQAKLPVGFRLQSLADENDHRKIHRCLWRGFDHEGEQPAGEVDGPGLAQGAPNFRKDLTLVAVAPRGDYVSYAGLWFVPENGIVYIEPVATDPDYRRMGLATAAVFEGLRRARALGAKVAWVGPTRSSTGRLVSRGFSGAASGPSRWLRNVEPSRVLRAVTSAR